MLYMYVHIFISGSTALKTYKQTNKQTDKETQAN